MGAAQVSVGGVNEGKREGREIQDGEKDEVREEKMMAEQEKREAGERKQAETEVRRGEEERKKIEEEESRRGDKLDQRIRPRWSRWRIGAAWGVEDRCGAGQRNAHCHPASNTLPAPQPVNQMIVLPET